jgi:hypothetical protein
MTEADAPERSLEKPSRLLKKAHLRRWRAPATLRRTRKYASRLGSRAALHLDLFEQPGKNKFFSSLLGRPSGCG